MENKIIKFIRQRVISGLIPEGEKGIKVLGHRTYVGGRWDEIGNLQFEFILNQGLKPDHTLIDVGCGSFRGGRYFIDYLNAGNYLGIDKEKKIVDLGLAKEIGQQKIAEKKPNILISDAFEFNKFSKKPDYGISVSLFTHLNPEHIKLCLVNLKGLVKSNHSFFPTFYLGDSKSFQETSHSLAHIEYTKDDMLKFGKETGWKVEYIGDWGHPRDQKMIKFYLL